MKVLLIHPTYETSIWTYSEVHRLIGCVGHTPNIALPTLAAMAPEDVEVTIHDEASEPINYDQKWDVVGITGYVTQRNRMIAIAEEFRKRGQLVAMGGPFATLSQSTIRPHADVLFLGEAENIWPEFLSDFRKGSWKKEYRSDDAVDLHSSPIPDISKLGEGRYMMGVVQTSRGCPFECEFCDVIVFLGRKQRHKKPERVVEELENLYQAGYRFNFLADDNLTANRKKCAEIMKAVAEWNHSKPERTSFLTQMSIDVARDQDEPLLQLCADAGLATALIGIESPDPEALRDVKKRQNLKRDLVQDIHRIQSHGIMVIAGMICGFDTDTKDCFRRQYDFVQEAGIPVTQLSLLNAPEGTPMERRLINENRLKPWPYNDLLFETNVIPKRMTYEDLVNGFRWLLNRLYSPEAYLQRVKVLAENSPRERKFSPTREAVNMLKRIVPEYRKLGPEFAHIPELATALFRDRDATALGTILLFYLNTVLVLRKRNVWNPELGMLEDPDFELASA